MKNILFYGDSLTAGYGLKNAEKDSFPGLIQQKIKTANLPFECINAGLSGDTSAGGYVRLDYWLARHIDIFVLELGTNDILRGLRPNRTSENLQMIIDKVRLKYPMAKMALMGMEIPDMIGGLVAPEFRGIFRKLAAQNSMALVPFFLEGVAGQPRLNLPDGLHPSAEGYKIIADHVWPVLLPLLEEC